MQPSRSSLFCRLPVFRFTSEANRARTALIVVAIGALTACQLDKISVQGTTPTLVVHAVLNPSATSQIVLLERSLTGQITVDSTANELNQIAGGIPVSGAFVEIIDSAGNSTVGAEEDVTDATAAPGVYQVPLQGGLLRLGSRYELHIHTQDGEDATAFTRVPVPEVTSTGALTQTFNRDNDTLAVAWPRTPEARAYMVRVESPFGPFFIFTDSLALQLTGRLRNPFASDLQRLFIPGFRQDVIVAAVDSNYYNYYRTNNDPFTGSGIISSIKGGIGLFGSLVLLNTGTLTVTANQVQPIEGRFRVVVGTAPSVISQFTLYIESAAARSDLPAALSGSYRETAQPGTVGGLIGQMLGSTVKLALLGNQLASDTIGVFVGELRGDTLSGTFTGVSGTSIFIKQ